MPADLPEPDTAAEPRPVVLDLSRPFREAKERQVRAWERAYLEALIEASGGNVARAARAARMDRNHLRDLLHRHGLIPSEPR